MSIGRNTTEPDRCRATSPVDGEDLGAESEQSLEFVAWRADDQG
jgi:hypothetical protein